METLEEKIKRVTAEVVDIADYDDSWPKLFEEEKEHILTDFPLGLIARIEHFGSTSVSGMIAKPIVDMLIEVTDAQRAKVIVPEILEPQGYDCFWRPTAGDDTPPWYTWCIKRGANGRRTHHLHFAAIGSKAEDLRFRDILRMCPEVAAQYGELKKRLSREHRANRVAYTQEKGKFIKTVLEEKNY